MDTKIFTCEQCHFWRPVEAVGPVTIGAIPRGNCYGVPPTPVEVVRHGVKGQKNLRAQTPAHEPACALFIPTAGLQEALMVGAANQNLDG
jgi:hypothetical protein